MKAAKWEPKAIAAASASYDWDALLKYAYCLRPACAPGIHHLNDTEMGRAVPVYCDGFGCVRGILILENPDLLLTVDPSHRRQGVATKLMHEAIKHWPIVFESRSYTCDGAAFISKFLGVES